MSYDPQSSTYFQFDTANNEYVAVPRNDADAAAAAAAAGGGGGGGGGAASDSTAASAADTADDADDAAANASVQPAVKYEHQFPALLILSVLFFFGGVCFVLV